MRRRRQRSRLAPANFDPQWNQLVADYFYQRFGVTPGFWAPYRIFRRGDEIWLTTSPDWFSQLRITKAGMRLLRLKKQPKPTTVVLQWLNDRITRSRFEVSPKDMQLLLQGGTLPRPEDITPGYVALAVEGLVLGCGLATARGIVSQIPAGKARELLDALKYQFALGREEG